MLEQLRPRWPHLLVTLAILIALSPTPVPQAVVASLSSANIALEAGQLDAALNHIDLALSFDQSLEILHIRAAEIALAADEPLQALSHLDRTPSQTSTSNIVDCLRSRALLTIGNLEQAITRWEKAGKMCPDTVPFLAGLAQAYLKENDFIKARSILEELISVEPLHHDGLYSLALITASIEPENALPILIRVETISPSASPLSHALIQVIEGALAYDDPSYTLAQVGQTFARFGKWDMATQAFQNALILNPEYIEARAYLGLALDRSGRDGLEHIMAAIEAAQNAALPRIFLAIHWQGQGQPDLALEQLDIASQLDPTNPLIAAELGAAYAALGDPRSAIAAYRHATDLAPKDPRYWKLLAQFSLTNEIEIQTLGLPAARNAVVLDSDDPTSVDALAYAHYLLGNFHLSERLLWLAMGSAPQSADIQYHLGLLRDAQGEIQKARAAFMMAIQLDPGGSIGQLAERVLINIGP